MDNARSECDGTGRLLQDATLCEGSGDKGAGTRLEAAPAPSLAGASADILALLKTYSPVTVPGVDPSLHYLPPHVPKVQWTALGDLVAARERESARNVDGSRWISLRLDGSGFSKAVRMMRRNGILEPEGFSERFAGCMQACLRSLMDKFHGSVGYTQSDEMIVFIPPTRVIRGEQQPHSHSGRVTKLSTLAAGYVTSHFALQLSEWCVSSGIGLNGLASVLPHFDCRLGHYESWEEARALLMWRAYDCSVNGVSDAVYHTKVSGKQKVQGLGKREKVEWLCKQGLLPLPRHQAYGSVLVRSKREVVGFNPKTNEAVTTQRSVIDPVDGPVLELMRSDSLFPEGVTNV